MSERIQTLIIVFIGISALILVGSIGYAAIHGQPLDVSASTLAGTTVGALGGFLTSSRNHLQNTVTVTETKPELTPPT